MAGWDNNVLYGDNVDFSGGDPVSGKITQNGQLLIGSTVAPNIRVGTLKSVDGSVVITVGAGSINLAVGNKFASNYVTDSGTASPAGNSLTLSGSGSITTSGSGSTVVTKLQGLTAHCVLLGAGTSTINPLANGTTGQVLTANTGSDPTWTTLAPGGVTSVTGTANRITSTGGTTPVIDISASYVGQSSITTLGTIATGVWQGTAVTETHGGTNQISYATGDILYASGANTLSKLGIGSSGQVLNVSGGIPAWTTLAPGGVTSITGTANQIAASAATGAVTLSLVGPYTPATYTTHGLLIGEGTSSITAMAAGSAGQFVQSGGASADPVWSTATLPSTATGTGTLLRADGTNWVASTSTYPNTNAINTILYASSANVMSALATANDGLLVTSNSGVPSILAGPGTTNNILLSNAAAAPSFSSYTIAAPGTVGNVLTSDGTNWTSSAAGGGTSLPVGSLMYIANAGGAPAGNWLLCNGATYSQATYPALYSALGLLDPGGTVWTNKAIPSQQISSFIYGSNFVYGGPSGIIYTSTDLVTFTNRNTGTVNNISALAYGNSLYIFGSSAGAISTSTDAITWTARTSNLTGNISALTYGTVYAATTVSGQFASSTDGITWTQRSSPTNLQLNSLIYGNSKYVAVGFFGTICTSTDATTWNSTTPTIGTTTTSMCFTYGNSLFLGTSLTGILSTSTDATTWTGRASGTTSNLFSTVYGTAYVFGGAGGLIASSTDAITWTARTSNTTSSVLALVYGTVHLYGTAGGGLGTSTDGTTWTARTSGTSSNINALAYGNSLFVYGGAGGVLATSTDAITWTSRSWGSTSVIYSLIYGNSLYVLCGQQGAIATSTNAITWTIRSSQTATTLNALTYGNGVYVAVGIGYIGSSTDAVTWTTRIAGSGTAFTGVAYKATSYYATSTTGITLSSTDGTTWTQLGGSGTTTTLNCITYGSNFVIGGNAGYIASSTDAITWTARVSTTNSNVTALTYTNSTYFYAGTSFVGTSTDNITWNQQAQNTAFGSPNTLTSNSTIYAMASTLGLFTSSTGYAYNSGTQFVVPTDANVNGAVTIEFPSNFKRGLYIKSS